MIGLIDSRPKQSSGCVQNGTGNAFGLVDI